MSLAVRVLIGTLIGVFAAFILHPVTRAYYNPISNLRPARTVHLSPLLPQNVDVAPQPANENAAGYWMVLATERLRARKPVDAKLFDKYVEVSSSYLTIEPGNAFWGQVTAVLEEARGREAEALEAWDWASRRDYWDDHQSSRLKELRTQISAESGGPQSWHWLEAHAWRSTAGSVLTKEFARRQWKRSDINTVPGLQSRYRILVNGRRLRDGSRYVPTFLVGMNIIDLSARVTADSGDFSPRQLLVSRLDFIRRLELANLREEASGAQEVFRQYGSWSSLVNEDEAAESLQTLRWEALLCAVIPSAFVSLTAVGLALCVLGSRMTGSPQAQQMLTSWLARGVALILAIVVTIITRQPVNGLVILAVAAFLGYSSPSVRSTARLEMSPMFRTLTLFLSLTLSIVWCVLWSGNTLAGQAMFPRLGIPPSLGPGSPALITVVASLVALLLSVGPLFSFFEKYPSAKILALVIRQMGWTLLSVGLFGSLLIGPLAVKYDRDLQPIMERILDNEPAYFYNRTVGPRP
jgi:hypothetical protein